MITDIQNAVSAGKAVTVSKTNITDNGWTGCGYIVINPETGAGAYMISGGLNGAAVMTFMTMFIYFSAWGDAWKNISEYWVNVYLQAFPKIKGSSPCPGGYQWDDYGGCTKVASNCPPDMVWDGDAAGGSCVTDPFNLPQQGEWCGPYTKLITRTIGVGADVTQIACIISIAVSGGVTAPAAGTIGIYARNISVANGAITALICGPSFSTFTTGVGAYLNPPGWKGILWNGLDATLTAVGY